LELSTNRILLLAVERLERAGRFCCPILCYDRYRQ
jgi:hypothetical protein